VGDTDVIIKKEEYRGKKTCVQNDVKRFYHSFLKTEIQILKYICGRRSLSTPVKG
jgi:hypothetical protein